MNENIDNSVKRSKSSTNRRPIGTRLKQQKLPAWQPVVTVKTSLPLVIAVAVVFIPVGALLLITSISVQEVVVPYTGDRCKYRSSTCDDFLRQNPGLVCNCKVKFELHEAMKGQVYMLYALSNFFQNHRRYVKSRDWNQLRGSKVDYQQLSANCEPYRGVYNKSYAPCGAIANSLFNDSIALSYEDETGSITPVRLIRIGIAWDSDKSTMFRNPTDPNSWSKTLPPPNWHLSVTQLDQTNSDNTGYENEDLIVWMRTAAFPNFRKLYRIVDHHTAEGPFRKGLPPGSYSLTIDYAYPVSDFGGTKSIVLTTTSWLGGRNHFLGIAYLVVGVIFALLSVAFAAIHKNYSRSTCDEHALSKSLVTDDVQSAPSMENRGRKVEEQEDSATTTT